MTIKLQTQIPLQKAQNQIDYDSRLVLLGSCFSENIGQKFRYYKFRELQNPFGILFHPLAIANLVSRAVLGKVYTEDDVFFFNERWQCYDAHSDLSAVSKDSLLNALNQGIEQTANHLKQATHICITLGTAWVYRHAETDAVVANCHKVPQKQFSKELMRIEEIVASLNSIMASVQSLNPNAQFIFTVSPVRHLKDGFVENQRSKAHLVAAVHEVVSASTLKADYFPSYEIQMDELRDYRFYKEDMVHPNALAVNYIWKKFVEVWLASNTSSTMKKIEKVQKGMLHKPFNENSDQHQKFLMKLNVLKSEIQKEFPHIQF
ncbi:GSCFA domain-containing protein [Zobellia alginiliquefaciens]|uniref:GSCFA domain-containing protein n=1 Tax=Zobellia alginiliquefaciens TaxID=3032586 RepID=UPI0032C4011D